MRFRGLVYNKCVKVGERKISAALLRAMAQFLAVGPDVVALSLNEFVARQNAPFGCVGFAQKDGGVSC